MKRNRILSPGAASTKQPLSVFFSVTLKERPLCFRKDPYGSCSGTAMDPFPQIKSQHTFRPQQC